MKRRTFLKTSCAALGLAVLGENVFLPQPVLSAGDYQPFTTPLPVPPLLENLSTDPGTASFSLTAQRGKSRLVKEFLTPTMGYNGNYLGPTIRVRNGQKVHLNVLNKLDQQTTLHWHGLHVPAEFDGGPRQPIAPGTSWQPKFTINQQAATLWYHPHAMGLTGEHVYMGLAGLFYIEDEVADSLAIPKTYGVDDFPLIIQDRRFFQDGTLAYVQSMMDVMHGLIGNILLVNGTEWPVLEVPGGLVRLRLLNGSNSTIYRIGFGDGRRFLQIATDGGFLEQPVGLTEVLLSPGERAEILVDFSGDTKGNGPGLVVDQLPGGRHEAMRFQVGPAPSTSFALPEKLVTLDWLQEKDAVQTRTFSMETFSQSGPLAINGKHMDMNRIDEKVKLGTTEIWEISNLSTGMMQMPHSMHLHDVQFQVLDRNGQPPEPQERGRKDTVLILPGEKVRIIARFEDYTGIYMYHCHLLEHEDRGMMGQFEVVE
ncbi:multicopper oxidase family protein [Desulfopila aestuarii]|uniref:Bilirubin oxidase n=1 Tax=Desulfopila aestuarii DSM 18488 TaxID=1121416 RepID=A0A1M7Y4Q1_9BACT|nr:multicopper oxidase domain-containing protein [Desulfopila aestuarii]SHO47326.1 bilirubin oxidase [Desulfopila aestuarii DSM 18488]